jgi:hypothetical protein
MKPAARSSGHLVCIAVIAAASLGARSAAAEGQTPAPPSPPPVKSSYQTWTSLSALGPIYGNLLFFMDLHGRFYDDMHPYQILVRPALGYKLPHGFSVFAGYGFTPSWNDKREFAEEHRAWQQLSYEAPIKAVKLTARARVEERFRPESDVAYRLRTMVRVNVPLGLPIPLQTVVWDELFLGLNTEVKWQPEVMDQNRLFVGLGYVFNKNFRLDVGYMSHIIPRPDATTVHHCLNIAGGVTW